MSVERKMTPFDLMSLGVAVLAARRDAMAEQINRRRIRGWPVRKLRAELRRADRRLHEGWALLEDFERWEKPWQR